MITLLPATRQSNAGTSSVGFDENDVPESAD
jgi:hypothetical protein